MPLTDLVSGHKENGDLTQKRLKIRPEKIVAVIIKKT